MSNSSLTRRRSVARLLAAPVFACLIGASLAGCGSLIADAPLVGLPEGTPKRKEQGAFLPVHDMPAPRESAKLETAEQARLRAELAAARAQQEAAAAAAAK